MRNEFAKVILTVAILAAPTIASAATVRFTTSLANIGTATATGNIFGALGTLPANYTAPITSNQIVLNTSNFNTATTGTASGSRNNPNTTAIPGWSITSSVGNNNFAGRVQVEQPNNGANKFVQLSGTTGNGENSTSSNGTLTTAVTGLTAGTLYTLSFDFAGGRSGTNNNNANRDTNLVEVQYSTNNGTTFTSLGFVTDIDTEGATPTFARIYSWNLNFQSTSVLLRFIGTDLSGTADGIGGRIDNVSLQAVPLPPIVWMLGASMLGWLGFSSRKRLGS